MLFYRLIRNARPAVKWTVCGVLGTIGVALVVAGLATHSTILEIRGPSSSWWSR